MRLSAWHWANPGTREVCRSAPRPLRQSPDASHDRQAGSVERVLTSRGATAALRPLRHRSFALLWSAGLISVIGTWMQTVAVGALVISQTGKATWAVLVAAGAFLPLGLVSPIGGALAERLPRRPMLVAGNVA